MIKKLSGCFVKKLGDMKIRNKLITTYILIALFSMLIITLVCINIFSKALVEKQYEATANELKLVGTVLDLHIKEKEELSIMLLADIQIQQLLTFYKDNNDLENMKLISNAYKKVAQYISMDLCIDSAYIIDNYGNIHIRGRIGGKVLAEDFLKSRWYHETIQLEGRQLWLKSREIFIGDYGLISLVRVINDTTTRKRIGILILNFKESFIRDIISENTGYLDNISIYSEEKNLIYASGTYNTNIIDEIGNSLQGYLIKKIDGKDQLFVYTNAPGTNMMLAGTLPTSYFLSGINTLKRSILLIFLLTAALTVIISVLMGYSISKPIDYLISLMKKVQNGVMEVQFIGGKNDEIGLLGMGFNSMLKQLNASVPIRREKLVNMLLNGDISEEEYSSFISELNIDFNDNCIQVLGIELVPRIDNSNNAGNQETDKKLLNLIASYEDVFEYKYGKGIIFVILGYKSTVKLKEIIREIRSLEAIQVTITIGVGNKYKGIVNIKRSYQEAKKSLNYKLIYGVGTDIYLSDIEQKHYDVYFPEELEDRIKLSIKACEKEQLKKLIEELCKFMKEQELEPAIVRIILENIILNCTKILINIGVSINRFIEDESFKILKEGDLSDFYQVNTLLESILLDLTDIYNNNRKKSIASSIKKAIKLVEENYENNNLDLKFVSEYVGLRDEYFCRLFKQETGSTFLEYLTNIRMEKAKELLVYTDLKVRDISMKTGFSNANYFGSVFKKSIGLTPNQYRKNHN